MRVKKFVGNSVNDAVTQLRQEFGDDAVVLHTKRISHTGIFKIFGRFRKPRFEVIGAVDPNVSQERRDAARRRARERDAAKEVKPDPSPKLEQQLSDQRRWPEAVQTVFQRLSAQDFGRESAKSLITEALSAMSEEDWSDAAKIWSQLRVALKQRMRAVEPWALDDDRHIVVLVGPTGVGKTTTLAKIAANYALVAGKDVGLITVDTYRMAAVEQLRSYAEIIGVPLKIVHEPADLSEEVQKFADKDLVLIDTAGRSHRNAKQMDELRTLLEQTTAEVHLVVSASTKRCDILDIVRYFQSIGIHRLIVSKLDETTCYGVLFDAVDAADVPVSFITTGQSVPEDIEFADGEKLTSIILGD